MKCSNCGSNLSVKEVKCAYCGTSNPYFEKHRADMFRFQKDYERTTMIQIIDTKDGLKEVGRIEDANGFQEFYIWNDMLVLIKEKYFEVNNIY